MSAPRRLDRARFVALFRFEVAAQLREPLTTLYALVFLLLAFGYAASDAVELVGARGSVPKQAPWALMLAFGGLTAFGQVITTMITTTAMLRDEAQRTRALIASSGVPPRLWFLARVSAAVVLMLLVYAAMPVGMLLGTLMSAVTHSGPAPLLQQTIGSTAMTSVRAYLVITVPTMLVVTLLLASAAALTKRVLGVLSAALLLVGIWQLSLALVDQPGTRVLGALLDPFGNAPVLALSTAWSEAQRVSQVVPLTGVLLANRLLWLGVAAVVAGAVLYSRAAELYAPSVERAVVATHAPRVFRASAGSALAAFRQFTAGWMTGDGGWRAVSALAVLNALANAMLRPLPDGDVTASALLLVSEHARLFLILLATVYAGELIWRERDLRVDQLIDALPVSQRVLVLGRIQGLLLAQGTIVLPLVMSALLVAVARGGHANLATVTTWSAWSVFVLWLPFAQLTLLSLAVHAVLDHKVGAHLLLITGWVLAVTLDRQGVAVWWLRFAEPAPLMNGPAVNWIGLAQRGAY